MNLLVLAGRGPWLEPPLTPSGDEARSALRRELARPEYHDLNLVRRALDWIGRTVEAGLDGASGSSPLVTLAAMVVLLALVGLVVSLVTRTRRSRAAEPRDGGVLTDEVVTAADLRHRAEAALAEGRTVEALVDGFRALTLRQVERGRLDDVPGATAHEVALALEARYPTHGQKVDDSAAVFDAVLYGGREASAAQAQAVLGLDDELAGAR